MRKFVGVKILSAIVILSIFCGNLMASASTYERAKSEFREIEDILKEELKTAKLSSCLEVLVPLYDIETVKFLSFLEENFRSKNANTTLVDIALKRFVQYKQTLENALFSMEVQATFAGEALTSFQELTSFQRCVDIQKAYQDMAKQHMLSYIKSNSSQKKTSALVEKYESLNSRMGEMNLEIAYMKGYFLSFKNRLPGFIKSCFTALT